MSNSLIFFINNISSLKFKFLKIFYKDLNFEYYYTKILQFLFVFLFFILILFY